MVSKFQVRLGDQCSKNSLKRNYISNQHKLNLVCALEGKRGKYNGICELLLVYIDDVFAVKQLPESIMKDVLLEFDIKEKKYGPPTDYLVANVEPFQV